MKGECIIETYLVTNENYDNKKYGGKYYERSI